MGLVNPALGLFMLFLNSYDSYKTLKYPPPSSRASKDGANQPSVRAISQRKRSMKGLLCVWIVWSCMTVYERTAEPVVSLFVPFYESFKTIVLLFLLLTRARGAEPIYLHVVRPLVKPYVPTLDFAFDVVNMVGGIIAVIVVAPLHLAQHWRYGVPMDWSATRHKVDIGGALQGRPRLSQPQQQPRPRVTSSSSRNSATSSTRNSGAPSSRPTSSRRQSGDISQSSLPNGQTVSPSSGGPYEIWDPASVTALSLPSVPSTPPRPAPEQDDWHGYPPLPSAYPATPQSTASSTLPSDPIRRGSESTLRTVRFEPVIAENDEENEEFPQGSSASVQSGRPTASLSPPRISVEDEEEDDFDVSFQTPRPAARKNRTYRSHRTPTHHQVYGPPAASSLHRHHTPPSWTPMLSPPLTDLDLIASPAVSSTLGIGSTLATSSEDESDHPPLPPPRRPSNRRTKTAPASPPSQAVTSHNDFEDPGAVSSHSGDKQSGAGTPYETRRPKPSRTASAPQPQPQGVPVATRSSSRLNSTRTQSAAVMPGVPNEHSRTRAKRVRHH